MPEIVIKDIAIQRLKAGDVIRDWCFAATSERPTGTITEINAKSKFTYFKVEDHSKEYRFANEVQAKVEREQLTAEEQRAREIQRALEEFDMAEQLTWRRLADARDAVIDKIAKQESLDPWTYDRLMEREAAWEPFAWILRIHQAQAEKIAFDGKIEMKNAAGTDVVETITDISRWTVLDQVVRRMREELLRDLKYGSRSTSTMHNMYEDYKRQAHAAFIEEAEGIFGKYNRNG